MYCGLEGSKEGKEKGGGSKETVCSGGKCSIVECWFLVNANCFVNAFACKESSSCEYCILICEHRYTNPCLLHKKEKVTALQKEQV
jgi:hypothetical protein